MDDLNAGSESGRRIDDPAFWQELRDTFITAIDLLEDIARAHGVATPTLPAESVVEQEHRLDEEARDHPLAYQASRYADLVNAWLNSARALLAQWGEEAIRQLESDGSAESIRTDAEAIEEALHVVASHRYSIHVKLVRALRNLLRSTAGVLEEIPGETDASARAAMACINASVEMWMRLLEFFPQDEDAILELLVQLDHIRRATAHVFPSAATLIPSEARE